VINTLRKKFKKKVGNAYFRRTSSYKLRKACDFSVNMNMLLGKLLEKDSKKKKRESDQRHQKDDASRL
jgi:hypothetical protein